MDNKSFIKSLNQIFAHSSQMEGKYSQVWLSEVDFGGLYYNGKFKLNVKAGHELETMQEISTVIQMINEQAPQNLQKIWNVGVYNPNQTDHFPGAEDILVFAEEAADY